MSAGSRSPDPRRIVVVSGASGGIGRATAIEFARHGWHVALLARGQEGLEHAQREIERLGSTASVHLVDVADDTAVEAAAAAVEQAWGPIDVWVNNAMATVFSFAIDVTADEFRRATEVTYLGTVWGTSTALRRMQARDRGTIVQVGSALAYRSIPLQAAYCGAKAAIRGYTDSLRCELIHARSNVHLTMVQLSAFNTPQFDWGRSHLARRPRPMGRIFQPELAARAIYFAATHRRREVWVGWPAVQSILGTRLLPGLLDRILGRRAVEGQLTDEPLPLDRTDNLYAPATRDHGAHGRFDRSAKADSLQFRWVVHRRAALAGITMIAVIGILVAWALG